MDSQDSDSQAGESGDLDASDTQMDMNVDVQPNETQPADMNMDIQMNGSASMEMGTCSDDVDLMDTKSQGPTRVADPPTQNSSIHRALRERGVDSSVANFVNYFGTASTSAESQQRPRQQPHGPARALHYARPSTSRCQDDVHAADPESRPELSGPYSSLFELTRSVLLNERLRAAVESDDEADLHHTILDCLSGIHPISWAEGLRFRCRTCEMNFYLKSTTRTGLRIFPDHMRNLPVCFDGRHAVEAQGPNYFECKYCHLPFFMRLLEERLETASYRLLPGWENIVTRKVGEKLVLLTDYRVKKCKKTKGIAKPASLYQTSIRNRLKKWNEWTDAALDPQRLAYLASSLFQPQASSAEERSSADETSSVDESDDEVFLDEASEQASAERPPEPRAGPSVIQSVMEAMASSAAGVVRHTGTLSDIEPNMPDVARIERPHVAETGSEPRSAERPAVIRIQIPSDEQVAHLALLQLYSPTLGTQPPPSFEEDSQPDESKPE